MVSAVIRETNEPKSDPHALEVPVYVKSDSRFRA
jgi:hypothetical protein